MKQEYAYARHRTSGDVWAVEIQDGTIIRTSEPVHYTEITNENLSKFDYTTENADWLMQQDIRIMANNEYYVAA